MSEVDARRVQLATSLRAYLDDHLAQIRETDRRVDEQGPLGAAPEADRIANARVATYAEGLFFEATHGADDKAPINFLERGMWAARCVGRVVGPTERSLGSGFLVAPGLFITNNHVLPDRDAAADAILEFEFERDAAETPRQVRRFALEPGRIFATSPMTGGLDFTFVAVSPRGTEGHDLAEQTWLPTDERRGKIVEGQPVVVIQHPGQEMKTICLFDSVCRFRDEEPQHPYLLYTTDTDFGSSGSPAFNRFWQVVALHHAAVEMPDPSEAGRAVVMNRGIRISSIYAALRAGPADGRLIAEPSHVAAILAQLTDAGTRRNGRPFSPARAIASVAAQVAERSRGTRIDTREAAWFADRRGYDEAFLGGGALRVPLPQAADWLAPDLAPLLDGSGHVLRYQNFSIAVSASRRLALFTACNIDGAAMLRLGRKDRDPDRPLAPGVEPEASDVWFFDGRLAPEHQLGAMVYDRTTFEYGHMVRRLDACWGDARTARLANDDTFFMTNCAPQEETFHRFRPITDDDSNWSVLEEVILDAINDGDRLASVFTGPVLHARDPRVLGVKVPVSFWKIVAYVDGGRLRARGFVLDQREEVRLLRDRLRPERALDLAEARGAAPIRDIARMTGLDFGPLFDADLAG